MQQVNTALLSFGMSGQVFHAPFLHVLPGFNFSAVWQRGEATANEKYKDVLVYKTLESLLENKDIELVVVNTPNVTHFDYAKAALLAGKHVIVEKPFTVTSKEGEELIALAKEKNKLLSVYHNRRYDSDFKIVQETLQKGVLGPVVEAEFHYDRYKPELSMKAHKEVAKKGTGALYDLGSHLIDQSLQLFGKPKSLFADIRTVRPFSQTDDYFDLLLFYPNHRVRLKCSYLIREALPAYILHGEKGSFIKTKSDTQETALIAGKLPDDENWGSEPEGEKGLLHTAINGEVVRENVAAPNGNYADYYQGIYNAIKKGTPLAVTAPEGLDVIRVIEAAFLSSSERRVVAL